MRQRYDERCAGVCQGSVRAAHGLVNPQVVRTAEMMDMHCIIFVRGKRPDETVLSLARQKDITILATPYRMFTACGLLYEKGLEGGCDVS